MNDKIYYLCIVQNSNGLEHVLLQYYKHVHIFQLILKNVQD